MKDNLGLEPFTPKGVFRNPHSQTVLSRLWPQTEGSITSQFHYVGLGDGDKLVLAESSPDCWNKGDRIVVLVHGLGGDYQSGYMIRFTRVMMAKGYKVFRVNLRGCGPGLNHAKKLYHSGVSQDTRQVLMYLEKNYPNSPVTQVGVSLGGNITLKMAGEGGLGTCDSIVAISTPIDLNRCSDLISCRRNRFYDRYFARRLVAHVKKKAALEGQPLLQFPKRINLRKFDDLYTAPRAGFIDAEDYYRKASSFQFIPDINLPTLLLSSKDDPIVDYKCYLKLPRMDSQDIVLTDFGGHAGFFFDRNYNRYWLAEMVCSWLENRLGRRALH